MALIYRSILEIEDPDATFTTRASSHTQAWLRWKLQDSDFVLPEPGTPWSEDGTTEITIEQANDTACAVVRISVFEGRRDDAAQVKTTFTALRDLEQAWAWIDLERWTEGHELPSWVPAPPGITTNLLRDETARRGSIRLEQREIVVMDAAGALVADLVLDRERQVPLVVVSYNRTEGEAFEAATARGERLARRLAGVAVVYVLAEGAVSEFSRAMHQALGSDMDVHSGAIRTYLPGAGSDTDFPGRHRFVSFRKLDGRRPDLASLMIAPALFRRAVESPPPAIWRSSARALLIAASPIGGDYDELLRIADEEAADLKAQVERLSNDLADERESVVDLARQVDDLARRNRFIQEELRRTGATIAEPQGALFEPVLCTEVVEHARETLSRVVIYEDANEGALSLDQHADESWAPKAWLALQALEEYARAKADGSFDGDFKACCEQSAAAVVIPTWWIARSETKQTMANSKYRELRRLPVAIEVDQSGHILMEQHIKLEKGGSPSPRIHFHDDTRGITGKVHIGWLGDHLDSRAKS